jgi:hypothetical protein
VLAFVFAEHVALTLLDDIDAVTEVALPEDDVPGLEMLIPDAG